MMTSNFAPYALPNAAGMIANPFAAGTLAQRSTLGLTQIENFQPVQSFVDDTNTKWTLVKAYADSTVDVPDPKTLQIVDCWNHKFVGLKEDKQLYVYVVEGIRLPRVETEQPSRVLFQWFSQVCIKDFAPQMITEREWMKANVYAAPVVNGRVSKLCAICRVQAPQTAQPVADDTALIRAEGLTSGDDAGNTAQG